jgi:hypothetical protein
MVGRTRQEAVQLGEEQHLPSGWRCRSVAQGVEAWRRKRGFRLRWVWRRSGGDKGLADDRAKSRHTPDMDLGGCGDHHSSGKRTVVRLEARQPNGRSSERGCQVRAGAVQQWQHVASRSHNDPGNGA